MTALDDVTASIAEHRRNAWYYQRFLLHNPILAPAVVAYLDGGARPDEALIGENHYARGLVRAEDARRKLAPAPPPPAGSLLHRPPGWPDFAGFERIALAGRSYLDIPDTKDVLLDIGDHVYEEGIAIVGGRRVVSLGGRITAAGLSRAAGVGLALWPRTPEADYHFEGFRIQPVRNADGTWKRTLNDGIALRGPLGRVTIQNALVGPVAVKQGYTSAQIHPDVFQFQADFDGELRVHRFTGYTEYTGVMCSALLVRKQTWDYVNLVATGYSADDLDPLDIDPATRGHTAFGIYDAGLTKTLPGVTLSEFYWAKDPLQSFAGFSPPELGQRTKSGKPKDSSGREYDFVTEATVGPGYVSPGYV